MDKQKKRKSLQTKFFCSLCGKEVEFKKKNFLEFTQQKYGRKYLVRWEYGCPKCNAITGRVDVFSKSANDSMISMGLYNKD